MNKHGYARRHLGHGNTLKALTRTRRAAPGQNIGKAPGKVPGPARWRVHERKALQRMLDVTEAAMEREAAE